MYLEGYVRRVSQSLDHSILRVSIRSSVDTPSSEGEKGYEKFGVYVSGDDVRPAEENGH